MPTLLLAWCLAVLLAGPVVLLVHELGHAVAALLLTRGPVVVQTGRRAFLTPRLGRLTLALGPGGLQAGACWHLAPESRAAEAAIAAAGPLASLLTATAAGTACLVLDPPAAPASRSPRSRSWPRSTRSATSGPRCTRRAGR